jgi:hypothetical protein
MGRVSVPPQPSLTVPHSMPGGGSVVFAHALHVCAMASQA